MSVISEMTKEDVLSTVAIGALDGVGFGLGTLAITVGAACVARACGTNESEITLNENQEGEENPPPDTDRTGFPCQDFFEIGKFCS